MKQLEILYFLLTFIPGIISLGFCYFFYFSSKKEAIKPFLYFYTSFTLIIIFNFFTSYLRTNIPNFESLLYYFFLYLENPVLFTILIFTIPYFIHSLFDIPDRNKRDRIFILLAIITFTFHNAFRITSQKADLMIYATLLKNLIFLMVIIYCWLVLLMHSYSKESSGSNNFLRKLSFYWLLIVPAVINDTFLLDYTGIKFFPFIYSAVGISFSIYYYKITLTGNRKRIDEKLHISMPDHFLQKYDLSGRELEIVRLLLEGKSYKEIAGELFISVNTVKTHIRNIYPKLNVSSRHEIVRLINQPKAEPEN